MSKAIELLDKIKAAGLQGLSYSDCAKITSRINLLAQNRWAKPGLLDVFCYKNGCGRYVRNGIFHQGHPYSILKWYVQCRDVDKGSTHSRVEIFNRITGKVINVKWVRDDTHY